MKKNISINISGIIFHIEEDGYQKLKEYLESINKYFSTFEGSSEIVADIESRIAEIFLSKLHEGKQIITLEDVAALIATMGGIQDFQAVEEEIAPEPTQKEESEESQEESQEDRQDEQHHEPHKKLFRDKKRRLVGGVAAGIAHYLSIDPLWVRLVFIVLLFDVFLTFTLSSLVLLAYIILWIVVPESDELEEDKKLKKMYRNPQERVIGGVASGVAAYFDADITLIRVLFVLLTFIGGFGLIAYIVLWIILPEAKSITDKVQMKGEPVTLENIESNIKKTQEAKEHPKEESVIVRILLFPFRLIATILRGLARALGPIARFFLEFLRVVVGVAFTLTGLALLFAVLVSGSVILGITAGSEVINITEFPVELLQNTLPPLGLISSMIAVGIPALALLLLGLAIASRSRITNATVGWTMFAIWILGIIGLSFTLPSIIYDYRAEGEYSRTEYFDINADRLVFDIEETGYGEYNGVRLKLRGYDGDQVKVVEEFSARGGTKKEAIEYARDIRYDIQQRDSVLIFDSNIDYSRVNKLRAQDLMITVYIPHYQEFEMQNNFDDLIYYSFGYQGFSASQIIGNIWSFNPSGLECLTCTNYSSSAEKRREHFEDLYNETIRSGTNDTTYDFADFSQVNISGPYRVNIVKGNEYKVVLDGYSSYLDQTDVRQSDNELIIRFDNDDDLDLHRYNRKVTVKVIVPELTDIRFDGPVTADISGFEEDNLYVRLDGAAELDLDADVYSLELRMAGAANLELTGTGHEVNANVSTAASYNAYNYLAEVVTIKASGAAKARVYATDELNIAASLVSDVRYRGGAKVSKVKSSTFSSVREE